MDESLVFLIKKKKKLFRIRCVMEESLVFLFDEREIILKRNYSEKEIIPKNKM